MTHEEYVAKMVAKLTGGGIRAKASDNLQRIWISKDGRHVGTIAFVGFNTKYEGMPPAVRRLVANAHHAIIDAA